MRCALRARVLVCRDRAHPCPPGQKGVLRLERRNTRKHPLAGARLQSGDVGASPGWGRGWMLKRCMYDAASGEPALRRPPTKGPIQVARPTWDPQAGPACSPQPGAGGSAQVPSHLLFSVFVTSSQIRADLHYLFEEYSGLFASLYR